MRILTSALWGGGSGSGVGGPPRQGCVKVSRVHSEQARRLKLIRAPCPFFSLYFFLIFLLPAPWTAPAGDEGNAEGPTPPSSSSSASHKADGSRRRLEGFTQMRRGVPLMCTNLFIYLFFCSRVPEFFAAAEMLFEEQAATYGWLGVPGQGNSNHPSLLPSDEGKVLRRDTKGCLRRKCTGFNT